MRIGTRRVRDLAEDSDDRLTEDFADFLDQVCPDDFLASG
jgi:hypothetical protein